MGILKDTTHTSTDSSSFGTKPLTAFLHLQLNKREVTGKE